MDQKPKRLSAREKKTFSLLEEFDGAAQRYGLMMEWGYGKEIDRAQADYESTKGELVRHLNRLHNSLRTARCSTPE